MPVPDDRFEDINDDALILAAVKLVRFEARPSSVGPFGAAVLAWEVEGPEGFTVRLGRTAVGRTGTHAVQPQSTRVFTLSARAGFVSRDLGHVTVTVDEASCESFEVVDVRRIVSTQLRRGIDSDPTLSFRPIFTGFGRPTLPGGPVVKFEPGQIKITLRLFQHVEGVIDVSAEVDIKLGFGLEVVNGVVAARAESVSVDVSVPVFVWLIPGALIALPLLIANGKAEGRERGQQIITGLARLLDVNTFPGEGRRKRSVRILPGTNGEGTLVVDHCGDDLIRVLAQHSSTEIVVD